MAQPVGVVAVLVPQADLKDALPELLAARVTDPRGVAGVAEQCAHSLGQAQALVHLPEQDHAPIGRDLLAIGAQDRAPALELNLDR